MNRPVQLLVRPLPVRLRATRKNLGISPAPTKGNPHETHKQNPILARNRIGRFDLMRESSNILSAISWLCSALCVVVFLYFASAPPIITGIIRHYGFSSQNPWLWLYTPIFRLTESDFGGPMVWYCNSVWGANVVLIGSEEGPPWHVVALHALLGSVTLGVIALPFWRAWRRQSDCRSNEALQATAAPPRS